MPVSFPCDGTSLKHKLAELGYASYRAYQAGPLWKSIRLRVYELKGRTCLRCEQSPATAIHHTRYDMATLRGETLACLVPICDHCHRIEHAAEIEAKRRRKTGVKPAKAKSPPTPKRKNRGGKLNCQICARNARKPETPCCKSCARKIRRGMFIPNGDGSYRRVGRRYAVRPDKPVFPDIPDRDYTPLADRLLCWGIDREYRDIVK